MDMAMMLHMNAWLLLRMLRLIISLVEKKTRLFVLCL